MTAEIHKALEVLKSGGVLLYPTDTIWGIGCDATSKDAVERVLQIKRRPESKSLIVLVSDDNMLLRHLHTMPPFADELMEYASGPLTIVYPRVTGIAGNVLAGDGSAGIRLVRDEFCRKLISAFRKPVVSTSANVSGAAAPRNFSEIDSLILQQVDYVVNLRQHEKALSRPSAVVKLGEKGEIKIIRK